MPTRPSADAGCRRAEPGFGGLDAVSQTRAAALLLSCCGSLAWVSMMLDRRPFGTAENLVRCSEECWSTLGEDDLLEALDAHPRIGENVSGGWSAAEQSRLRGSAVDRGQLMEANEEYERQFGFRFVVFAEGKSPELIIDLMHRRLRNAHQDEFLLAADEAARITHGRMRKLAGP